MSTPLRAAIAFVRAAAATTILAAGLFGLAQGVVATPAPLADGSEIVVTDREGDHLLGYGRVDGGVLRLSFAAHDDGDGLAVMVIDPDGRLSTLVGRFAADGLRVRDPGVAEDVTLLSWLSERGVRLTLDPTGRSDDDERSAGRDDDDDDSDAADRDDDDRDDAPAGGPAEDGDDGDDDRDDDADDDDRDDDPDGDDGADDDFDDDGDDDGDDDSDDDGDDEDDAADDRDAADEDDDDED